jgi:hypothetical protein
MQIADPRGHLTEIVIRQNQYPDVGLVPDFSWNSPQISLPEVNRPASCTHPCQFILASSVFFRTF